MADIVLKDKNGSPVTYTGVQRVKIPTSTGGSQTFEPPFSMENTIWYYAKPVIDDSGNTTGYQIIMPAFQSKGTTASMCMVTDVGCQEEGHYNGSYYVLNLISSKKQLVTGNTYTSDEILYG